MTGSPSQYLAGEIATAIHSDSPLVAAIPPGLIADLILELIRLAAERCAPASANLIEWLAATDKFQARRPAARRLRRAQIRDEVSRLWPRTSGGDAVYREIVRQLDLAPRAVIDGLYTEAACSLSPSLSP